MKVSGQISYPATTFPAHKELLVPLNMRLNQSKCFVEVENFLYLEGIGPGLSST